MRLRYWIISGVFVMLISAGAAVFLFPLSDASAESIARDALKHYGTNVNGRPSTEISESSGTKIVSFDDVDGFDYVVQVRGRWSAEVHRMPVGDGE